MKFSATSFLSAALFVAGVSAQLTVNTPTNVIQCAPLTIGWTGGTGPYFLVRMAIVALVASSSLDRLDMIVHSGNDVNGAPLISFPSTNSTSLTWSAVNYTSGTQLDLSLRDSSGLSSQSAIFTVQSGGDSTCLNGATNATTPSSGSAAAPSATTPAASASGASSAGTKPSAAASGSSASSPSKASSTSSTSNAAMATGVQYGVAGLLGAAVAAVFV